MAKIQSILLPASGSQAVLLIHGFTGSSEEMSDLGHLFHDQGFGVSIPLLPGHGTQLEDMNDVTEQDWLRTVESAYDDLAKEYKEVFVIGLSMGASLGLRLAMLRPEIAALVVLACPYWIRDRLSHLFLAFLHRFHLWSWVPFAKIEKPRGRIKSGRFEYPVYPLYGLEAFTRLVFYTRENLDRVQLPVLLMHATGDSAIPHESMQAIAKKLPGSTKTVSLIGKEHVISCGGHLDRIFSEALGFIQEHSRLDKETSTNEENP